MAQVVCNGASLMCTFGAAPSTLLVPPSGPPTNTSKMVAATIMDYVPMKNIMPFGMCTSIANPQVASATAAASGVLTPQPCIPVVSAPWVPGGPTVLVGKKPVLTNTSKTFCNWAGVISVTVPGQFTTMTK